MSPTPSMMWPTLATLVSSATIAPNVAPRSSWTERPRDFLEDAQLHAVVDAGEHQRGPTEEPNAPLRHSQMKPSSGT